MEVCSSAREGLGAGRRARRSGSAALMALAAGTLALGTACSTALAGWSSPRYFANVPAYLSSGAWSALATDARGDVVLAWRTMRQVGHGRGWYYDASVQVALAQLGHGAIVRTVWRGSHAVVGGVSVAIDARGALTVAWIDAPSSRSGANTVRAASRSTAGRWSAVQALGHSAAFYDASPKLAVAPDRELLLTWNGGSAVGVEAAWAAPGHRFAAPSVAGRARGAAILEPAPSFDASGAAHVYGIVDCDHPTSRGVMLSTRPHKHGFLGPVVIAPAPAADLAVSFAAGGAALAAWERTECSTLEPSPGVAVGRSMRAGVWQRPAVLAPRAWSYRLTPVAAPTVGTVSWVGQSFMPAAPQLLSASVDQRGSFSPATVPSTRVVPVARDAAGDVVLEDLLLAREVSEGRTPGSQPAPPIAVQPAGAGAPEPAPLASFEGTPLVRSLSSDAIAVAGSGRNVALAWQSGASSRVTISIWRP